MPVLLILTFLIISDENTAEQGGQNSRRGTNAYTGYAHMEHQSAHVQRGAADHLLGVPVVEPVRNRIAGQAAALAGVVVPEGYPFGHR